MNYKKYKTYLETDEALEEEVRDVIRVRKRKQRVRRLEKTLGEGEYVMFITFMLCCLIFGGIIALGYIVEYIIKHLI
jgi:hypothetical protein